MLAFLEMVFEEAGFRVIAADDERQGVLQARQFKPAAVVSERPFRDEAALDGIPVVFASKPLDEAVIMARVLDLIEQREKTLPPPPPPLETPAPAAAPAPAKKAAKHWLVIMGSDPAAAASVDLAVLGMGLEVADARDAVHLFLRARTLKPKLIICDLDLPGFELGSGVLREFRENPHTNAVPFIFVGGPAARAPLSSADPNARFMAKPLDPEKLQALILRRLTGGPEPEELSEPAAERGPVLVLEGDPVVRGALDRALVELGFPMAAGDAAKALGQARVVKPALIISDLQAPGAVDLLTETRLDALLRGVPFLFIGPQSVEEAMVLLPWGDRSVRFMRKPLEPEKLKALVTELTDQPNESAS